MPSTQISEYGFAWHPGKNAGAAYIVTQGGRKLRVPIEGAAEFAAVAAVLSQPTAFLRSDGLIHSQGVAEDEE
ncbi:MAG TPA: hypothetical protein VEQ60_03085 [Longimicrobium sp.]|nr:hypothetical protein [Longimicrobium sp.]